MSNTTIHIYDENNRYVKSRSGSIDMLMATVEANNESYTLTDPPLENPSSYIWLDNKWCYKDNISIEVKRLKVWDKIKEIRSHYLVSGVLVASVNKIFQTDNDSMIQYSSIAGMIALDNYVPVNWKTSDNTYIELTIDLFKELQQSININTQRIFNIAEYHKTEMLNSDNPLEYDYSTNWTIGV